MDIGQIPTLYPYHIPNIVNNPYKYVYKIENMIFPNGIIIYPIITKIVNNPILYPHINVIQILLDM